MTKSMKSLHATLAVLALTAAASAQILRVNGKTTFANVPIGSNIVLDFAGTPGLPHVWAFNTGPGPTVILGQSIPVLIDGNQIEIGGYSPLPPSGVRTEVYGIAVNPTLVGLTIYSAGVVIDPNAPGGFSVTNGISFRFVEQGGSAGPDAVGFAGRPIPLDGSGNLLPGGQIPGGMTFQWAVLDGPANAVATLNEANTPFPSLVADTSGLYTVEVVTDQGGTPRADEVVVAVYSLNFTSPQDGSFVSAAPLVTGTCVGPQLQSFSINGASTALSTNGSFNGGTLALSGVMNPVTARVTRPDGSFAERTITVINSPSADLAAFGIPGSVLRVGGVTLDALEPPIEQILGAIPLNTLVTALPSIPLNLGLLTVNTTFTGATFDPLVDFDFFPTATNTIGVGITFTNLNITATLTGSFFGLPFTETATITSTAATVTGELSVGSNAQGGVVVSVINSNAVLNNFSFAVTGLLGGLTQIGAIQTLLRGAIETVLEGTLQLIPTALNPLLASVQLSFDLSAAGFPVTVDLPFNAIGYDVNGLTVANNFRATALVTGPNAPALTNYASTAGQTPFFGTTTPVASAPFDFAFGVNDDLVNQLLAQTVKSGALDLDLASSLGTGGGALTLVASALALVIPGAGFEDLGGATPITIRLRHTTAPAAKFSATGAATTQIWLGNLELHFLAETVPGTLSTILVVGVTADTATTITVDPQTGGITVTPGTPSVTASLLATLPGRDPTAGLAGLTQIVQQILPLLTAPLNLIALPGAGLVGGLIPEISVFPSGAQDMVVTYIDLP